MESNTWFFLHAMNFGMDAESPRPLGKPRAIRMIRSGSGYGNGWSNTVFTTEKMAVLAPMPSAKAAMATTVKPGLFRRMRIEWRRSETKLSISHGYGTATQKFPLGRRWMPRAFLSRARGKRSVGLLTLRCGVRHHAGDLAEDRADAGCNARHDRPRGNRDESRHQGVFDQVLSSIVAPYADTGCDAVNPIHCVSSRRVVRF